MDNRGALDDNLHRLQGDMSQENMSRHARRAPSPYTGYVPCMETFCAWLLCIVAFAGGFLAAATAYIAYPAATCPFFLQRVTEHNVFDIAGYTCGIERALLCNLPILGNLQVCPPDPGKAVGTTTSCADASNTEQDFYDELVLHTDAVSVFPIISATFHIKAASVDVQNMPGPMATAYASMLRDIRLSSLECGKALLDIASHIEMGILGYAQVQSTYIRLLSWLKRWTSITSHTGGTVDLRRANAIATNATLASVHQIHNSIVIARPLLAALLRRSDALLTFLAFAPASCDTHRLSSVLVHRHASYITSPEIPRACTLTVSLLRIKQEFEVADTQLANLQDFLETSMNSLAAPSHPPPSCPITVPLALSVSSMHKLETSAALIRARVVQGALDLDTMDYHD